MVMKKIIAFIICLALCVSGLAVGVMNQQAKSDTALGAANAMVGAGNVDISLDDIVVNDYDDSKVGASSLPAVADPNNDNGTLSGPVDGVYTLTGNVVIEDANDAVYKALVEAFEIKGVETTEGEKTVVTYTPRETHYTLDGNGYTISTAIPLFDRIGNCTVKNLVIAGDIEATDTNIVADAKGYAYITVITDVVFGEVNFEKVNVTANVHYKGTAAVNGGIAPFVGSTSNGVDAATLNVSNCAFSGALTWEEKSSIEIKCGGLISNIRAESEALAATVNVDKYTMAGTLNLNGHIGGITGELNSNGTLNVTNTCVEMNTNLDHGYGKTSHSGGIIGSKGTGTATIRNTRVGGTFKINYTNNTTCDVGGFVGRNSAGNTYIYDVVSTIQITKNNEYHGFTGGIIGRAKGNITIDGLGTTHDGKTAKITVTKTATTSQENNCSVGCVFAFVDGSGTHTIKNANVTTIIDHSATTSGNIGGVCGLISSDATVNLEDSTVDASITYSGARLSKTVIGVSGVIGDITGAAKVNIIKTEMKSDVSVTGAGSSAAISGGIGYLSAAATITITESTLSGTVRKTTGGDTAGGLIGRVATDGATFKIDGLEVDSGFSITNPSHYIGGIIGYAEGNTFNQISLKNIDFAGSVVSGGQGLVGGLIASVKGATTTEKGVPGIAFENVTFGILNEKTGKIDGSLSYPISGASDGRVASFVGKIIGANTPNGVSFKNCENNVSHNLLLTNADAVCASGFIGRVRNTSGTAITFTGCTNNGDVIVDSYAARTGNAWTNNAGGFIGLYHDTGKLTFEDCENTGNIAVYNHNVSAGISNAYAGGFIGSIGAASVAVNITNCVNRGNVTAASRTGNPCAGGSFGVINNNAPLKITNYVNYGDISATVWNGNGYSYNAGNYVLGGETSGTQGSTAATANDGRAAGIAGWGAPKTPVYTDCINLGNITATNKNNQSAKAGGLMNDSGDSGVFLRCINSGNITLNTTMAGQICGGITAQRNWPTKFRYCVNIGNVTSGATGAAIYAAGGANRFNDVVNTCVNMGIITDGTADGSSFVKTTTATNDVTDKVFGNCYNLVNSTSNILESSTESLDEFVTGVTTVQNALPAYLSAANVKSANTIDAKAYIALILANIAYNEANANEALISDYMEELGVFTVDATLTNGTAYTTIDKAFYDAIEAIAGDSSVTFAGIVTVDAYTEKAGDTIAALDAYLAAAKAAGKLTNIESLYRPATFKDGRTTQNLGSDETATDGKYSVKIYLNGADAETVYTARAFIKIGNAYIYSTVDAE